jgi:hypothetical protein
MQSFAHWTLFEAASGFGEIADAVGCVVLKTPDSYADWRSTFDIDAVEFGVGGIRLFRSSEVAKGQLGFAVASNGESLGGAGPGDWRPEWVVIGIETACGDPIFASQETPHPVFSAMHGQGFWEPKLVAPSIAAFAKCVRELYRFATGRSWPYGIDPNPPTPEQQAEFLRAIRSLTNGDQDALGFWAVQIGLDLDAFNFS